MIPGGFGQGRNSGEGGATGGRRDEMTGASLAESGARVGGAIVGGTRRGGMTGAREGRAIRAVSRFSPPFWPPSFGAARGGRAMRTVSFFGSAMAHHCCVTKIAEN